jgi:hypothetical protein
MEGDTAILSKTLHKAVPDLVEHSGKDGAPIAVQISSIGEFFYLRGLSGGLGRHTGRCAATHLTQSRRGSPSNSTCSAAAQDMNATHVQAFLAVVVFQHRKLARLPRRCIS